MLRKISELIETRKIMALSIVAALVYLVVAGRIDSKDFLVIVSMVVAFYFGAKKPGA